MSENVDPENPRPNKSIPSERRFYFDRISTRARVARGVPLSFLPLIWQKLVMLNASDTRVTSFFDASVTRVPLSTTQTELFTRYPLTSFYFDISPRARV